MKELGWTVIACPVCRSVERARVQESHEPGVLMGLLPKRGRAVLNQRCEGCGVEIVLEPTGKVHADKSLTAAAMLAIEEPDEAERIVATADLFARMTEGNLDQEERSDAIALVCDALMLESWSIAIRSSNGVIYCMSFVTIGTLIFSFAPRNPGTAADTLLIVLMLTVAIASCAGLFWMLWHSRRAKEQKRLPAVLRPLRPSIEELRRSVDRVCGDRLWRWQRARYTRHLHREINTYTPTAPLS